MNILVLLLFFLTNVFIIIYVIIFICHYSFYSDFNYIVIKSFRYVIWARVCMTNKMALYIKIVKLFRSSAK